MDSFRVFLAVVTISLLLTSCAVKPKVGINEVSFEVRDNRSSLSTDLSATPDGQLINIRVPYGTDLESLKPKIDFKGETIYPDQGASQDFRFPVSYTVKEGEFSRKYTIELQPDPTPDIFPVAGDGVSGVVVHEKMEIPAGGVIRLTAPPEYRTSGKKYPLHLHFHGAGGDSYGSELKFPFQHSVGTPGYEFFLASWESGEIDLLKVLDYLSSNYPVATDHIWLSGHSTGAWIVLNDACSLPQDRYQIELKIAIGAPYVAKCLEAGHHVFVSGSFDLVPFFGFLSNRSLYNTSRDEMGCNKETQKLMNFGGYPHQVRRLAAYDCVDNNEVHFYVLKGEMHNPRLSRNFTNNLMREAFRMTGVGHGRAQYQTAPAGDQFSLLQEGSKHFAHDQSDEGDDER